MEQAESPPNSELCVRVFEALQPYEPIWKAMQDFTDARSDTDVDQLWVLQHEPVFTQGQAGKPEHLLNTGNIPVVQVDRGGQVTYHGPGQLVVYLLIDLDRLGIGARQLVTAIEESIVRLLENKGIDSAPKKDAPGVYVDDAKVASVGLRIRRSCSFHGLSLNVNMDLTPFERINPCGYQGMKMVQLSDLGVDENIIDLGLELCELLRQNLGHEVLMVNYESNV